MSRFADKLKQVSQSEPQPMGFRKEKTSSKPRLLLVADVKDTVTAGVVEGADVALVAGAAKNLSAEADIPVGKRISNNKTGKLEGIDFVVLTPEMPVSIAGDEKIGKIMAVDASLEMGLLRALKDLPLDALFIIGDGVQTPVVTWQCLMLCKRLASISDKPMLLAVSKDISKDDLQLLWEAGVGGVVSTAEKEGDLKKLRSSIDSLILPSKKRRMKAMAIVPLFREESTSVTEEEDEDEEEE